MVNNKANWKVFFRTFLTHIRHDIDKGVDSKAYTWDNIRIERTGNELKLFKDGQGVAMYTPEVLGTEENHSEDNSLNWLTLPTIKSKITTENLTTGNNATIKKGNKMNTNEIVSEATNTIKTVGAQIQSSAITSAKMEAGEAILLALRNLVMQKAGFMTKVKFKFAPVLLDVAVTVGADILVTEIMPNKKSAKLACECLNLAMTKEVIHLVPLQDFTNALTGGEAFSKVKNLLSSED